MAGLYDGLEEVSFKPVTGGYVFQTSHQWLLGPRRRFFVTDAQKTAIAACLRDNLRRIKPFVLFATVLLPLLLIGGIYWFATTGTTLIVTVVEAGQTTTYTRSIHSNGATGTLAGAAGSHVEFHVSGPPGNGATVTVTGFNAAGKAQAPAVMPFDPKGSTVRVADDKGHIIRSAVLTARSGASYNALMTFAVVYSLVLFALYIAPLHAYGVARLQPLLADLPRSTERITCREGAQNFSAKMSNKFLVLTGVGAMLMLLGNALTLTDTLLSHHQIHTANMIGLAASILLMARFAYLLILRLRLKRIAARSA